jgi:type IV pilus assembly protein PilW
MTSVSPNRQRGMTMVELLVAMVIALGVTLAVTSLLIAGENHKRTTTSTNDADQTGAFSFNALDKMLRGAGSGFAETAYLSDRGVMGCRLNAAAILPRAGAFPAPFAGFLGGAPNNLRMAPVLIGQAQSADGISDVIMVMSGSDAAGGVPRQITTPGGSNTLILNNTIGFSASDLVVVSQNGTADCLLEEVINPLPLGGNTLNLGSTYYTTNAATTNITTLSGSTSTWVTPLGNAAINNLQFLLFGVDTTHTLYSYDLLQNQNLVQSPGTADAPTAIADGVYQMQAIYGIDTNGNGTQDAWAGPGDLNYDINTVMTTPATMESIVSVRIALVVRGEYYDKNVVSPPTLTLFNGLTNAGGASLSQQVNLNANDQHYRYRLFEFTVPLRNMILLAGGV